MKRSAFKIKFLSVCVAVLVLFCLPLTACKKGPNDGGVLDESAKAAEKLKYDGTHIYTAPDTDSDLVKDGKTEYAVVIPENKTALITRAKDEFVYLFKEATGININVISDGGLSHTADGKYISIGETELLKSSGTVIDKKRLGDDGVRIVTKDKTVYLCGGSDYGTVYAVYDFMQIYFGFETYYEDCFEIERGAENVKLKAFDVTDIPDIAFRSSGIGAIREMSPNYDKDNWKYRFRVPLTYGNKLMPIHEDAEDPSSPAKGVHNSLSWLPISKHRENHPKWYAPSMEELCYTAHGDEEELEAMVSECAKVMEAHLVRYPRELYPLYNIATLTCQDNFSNCTCDACSADLRKYGTYSASLIKFMNRLSVKVRAWMALPENEPYAREEFSLAFFAYHNFELAPATYNESTGKFDAADELYFEDGVAVYLAPSRTFDFMSPIYADVNTDARRNLEAWTALGGKLLLWTYSTNFWHYFYPLDSFSFYNQDAFEYFAANNTILIFNQSQGNQGGASTAWHMLKTYLDYKLEWDSSLDAATLTENYMRAMYGDAAEVMTELFTAMRMQAMYVDSKFEGFVLPTVTSQVDRKEYWPYLTVKQWLEKCDAAYEIAEKYRDTDTKRYEKIKRHIDLEWLSPAYMALTLHADVIAPNELNEIKTSFKEIVAHFGITRLNENGTINGFISSL